MFYRPAFRRGKWLCFLMLLSYRVYSTVANIHSATFTLPLQMHNWNKGMGLSYLMRGRIMNLLPFSHSRCLLHILLLFLTKSGPEEPEHCGAQTILLRRFPTVLWTPAQQPQFWNQVAGHCSATGARFIPEDKAINLLHWFWYMSCLFSFVLFKLEILRGKRRYRCSGF